MDEIDQKVMQELVQDARISYAQIAVRVGVSAETIRKRFERMRDDGMFLMSSISVDLSKLGFQAFVILLISSHDISVTSEVLCRTRNVIAVNRTMGEFDILAFALARDLIDLQKEVAEIRMITGVDHIELFIAKIEAPFPGGTIIHRLETPVIAGKGPL